MQERNPNQAEEFLGYEYEGDAFCGAPMPIQYNRIATEDS